MTTSGSTTVATGGCFDVLHVGHVRLLAAAAALGDRLVVLINSDASVRALKGAGRPITTAADRREILLALRHVDEVVVFDEPTPTAVLAEMQPDLWCKGGDYVAESLPEYDTVRAYGGRVVILPYVSGYSSTLVIGRIAASKGAT